MVLFQHLSFLLTSVRELPGSWVMFYFISTTRGCSTREKHRFVDGRFNYTATSRDLSAALRTYLAGYRDTELKFGIRNESELGKVEQGKKRERTLFAAQIYYADIYSHNKWLCRFPNGNRFRLVLILPRRQAFSFRFFCDFPWKKWIQIK